MILKLISPGETFTYDHWQDDQAPAVVTVTCDNGERRVWIKAANSYSENFYYFEQRGIVEVPQALLKQIR